MATDYLDRPATLVLPFHPDMPASGPSTVAQALRDWTALDSDSRDNAFLLLAEPEEGGPRVLRADAIEALRAA